MIFIYEILNSLKCSVNVEAVKKNYFESDHFPHHGFKNGWVMISDENIDNFIFPVPD